MAAVPITSHNQFFFLIFHADKMKNEIGYSCSKHGNYEKYIEKTLLVGRNKLGSHIVNCKMYSILGYDAIQSGIYLTTVQGKPFGRNGCLHLQVWIYLAHYITNCMKQIFLTNFITKHTGHAIPDLKGLDGSSPFSQELYIVSRLAPLESRP
jgi:hypothetical protein